MNTSSPTIRMNVTIPSSVIHEVKKRAPKRGVSHFITQALVEKIDRERTLRAFKDLEAMPPAFPHIKDSVRYINKLRSQDNKRLKRLGLL